MCKTLSMLDILLFFYLVITWLPLMVCFVCDSWLGDGCCTPFSLACVSLSNDSLNTFPSRNSFTYLLLFNGQTFSYMHVSVSGDSLLAEAQWSCRDVSCPGLLTSTIEQPCVGCTRSGACTLTWHWVANMRHHTCLLTDDVSKLKHFEHDRLSSH